VTGWWEWVAASELFKYWPFIVTFFCQILPIHGSLLAVLRSEQLGVGGESYGAGSGWHETNWELQFLHLAPT
jgi:hypothetical protein